MTFPAFLPIKYKAPPFKEFESIKIESLITKLAAEIYKNPPNEYISLC